MNSASAYRKALEAFLASYDEEVTRRLRDFVAMPFEPDAAHVLFEDFLDSHGTKFPVLIALTTSSSGVYCDARRCILSTMSFNIPPSLNPAASDCDVDDASEEWRSVFFSWFQQRWIAAGGLSYGLPASIGEHDAPEAFDLMLGKWISAR